MSGMIRRLRWKIVGISMLFVTLVLAAVFTGVMLTARSSLEQSSTRQLEKALRGEGYDGQNGQPCFVTEVYSSGTVRVMGSSYYQISEEDLLALVQECLSQQEESGLLTDYHLRYLRYDGALSIRIAFTDSTLEQSALRAMAGNLLLIALAALVVLLGCSYLLSGVAARPVERAWQEQQRFLSDASHELKTPLTVILSSADLLAESAPAEEQTYVENIRAESRRMKKLVEEMLTLARLDGNRALKQEKIDVIPLILDALSDAHVVAPDHAWELGEAADIPVLGDEAALRQILTNLLANARVHTPAGTRVVVSLTRSDDEAVAACVRARGCAKGQGKAEGAPASSMVAIRVADDGPGIPPEIRDRVFDRFVRGDSSRTRDGHGSSGLGMSIVESLARAMGGSVRLVDSEKGTVIEVMLPAA